MNGAGTGGKMLSGAAVDGVRWVLAVVLTVGVLSAARENLYAERTIHVFTVFCNAYPGEAGAINAGVSSDKVIVDHIFTEYVSPAAWGVKVRRAEVVGEAATKEGIQSRFSEFAREIGTDDTLYIHFSGHGMILDRSEGEQFLQTCDLGELSRDEWVAEIEAIPCRLKILITDCCSTYPEEFVVAEGDERVIPWKNVYYLLLKHEGFVNITAASPGQAAYGTDVGGFLTINLESDMQRFRTWSEVFASTRKRVYEETGHQLRGAGLTDDPQLPLAHSLGTPLLEIGEEDKGVAATLEYVLEDSAERSYSEEELYKFGLEQLYLARNEIFARHGYEFGSQFLQDYFGSLSWYDPVPGFKNPPLSALESANVAVILKVEKNLGGPYISSKPALPGSGEGQGAPADIFAYSSDRTLSRTVVQSLTLPELSIARNEIFARHGFPFSSAALQDYFGRKPDYSRDESATDPAFNPVEKHNIWLIEKIERLQGGPHRW